MQTQHNDSTLLTWCNEFLEFFGAIPEEKWYIGALADPCNTENRCALGHLKNDYNDVAKMWSVFEVIKEANASPISDGKNPRYPQPTPKQRILAALNDVKNILESRMPRKDVTKELAVLPPNEKLDSFTTQNNILVCNQTLKD